MSAGPSVLSLLGSGLYLLVVLVCLVAASAAVRGRQLAAHWRSWAMVAVLFGLFALLRIYNVEEAVKGSLREYFRADGSYADRRAVQAPLVAVLLAIFGAVAFALIYRWSRMVRVAMIPGIAQAKQDSSGMKLRPDSPAADMVRSSRNAARGR